MNVYLSTGYHDHSHLLYIKHGERIINNFLSRGKAGSSVVVHDFERSSNSNRQTVQV